MTSATPRAYSGFARTLHWITAVAVLTMIPAGLVMGAIKAGPLQNFLFDYHRSVGVLVFVVTLVRLAYRLGHPPLPLPADIPAWQQKLAKAVHHGLYVILLVNPLVGWVATSAYPAKITVFWLFTLPAVTTKNRPLSESLFVVHEVLGLIAAALVCLHLAGVFYHQFVRRDQVLMRMVTG